MTLSISCPNCGKQFRNIKPEMAGKKARCSCGTVVRLGPKKSTGNVVKSRSAQMETNAASSGIHLPDHLRGDERLGDELLGGDFSDLQNQDPPTTLQDMQEIPVVAIPPLGLVHPAPAKIKRQQPRPKSHGTESRHATNKSSVDDAYSDLDAILSGQGDAAPLRVRPDPATAQASRPAPQEQTKTAPRPSSIGFVAALGSSSLAFWFGVVVIVTRFHPVDLAFVQRFSQMLESVNVAAFGTADVSVTFQRIFISLGWAIWIVAIVLAVFALAQFANAFIRILFGRSFLDWSDGMTAAMAVCALFLMVALIFTHHSFTQQQLRQLDEYEQPMALDRGPIGNVEILKSGIVEDGSMFQNTMLVGMGVAMSIFLLTMVRLLLKTDLPAPRSDQA